MRKRQPRGYEGKAHLEQRGQQGHSSEKAPCLLCAREERGPMQLGSEGEGRGDKLRRNSVQVGPDGHGQECRFHSNRLFQPPGRKVLGLEKRH